MADEVITDGCGDVLTDALRYATMASIRRASCVSRIWRAAADYEIDRRRHAAADVIARRWRRYRRGVLPSALVLAPNTFAPRSLLLATMPRRSVWRTVVNADVFGADVEIRLDRKEYPDLPAFVLGIRVYPHDATVDDDFRLVGGQGGEVGTVCLSERTAASQLLVPTFFDPLLGERVPTFVMRKRGKGERVRVQICGFDVDAETIASLRAASCWCTCSVPFFRGHGANNPSLMMLAMCTGATRAFLNAWPGGSLPHEQRNFCFIVPHADRYWLGEPFVWPKQ